MSHTRVAESRAYDVIYDPVYTGPHHNNFRGDPRVTAAVSSATQVAGQGRYKYFRRPIMPRLTAVPPHVLLAPTVVEKAIKKSMEVQEPNAKDAEVQTMYRESEAQTNPYTPDYTVKQGDLPEVLLLKDMTYGNGLPLGRKEVEMIEHARLKKVSGVCTGKSRTAGRFRLVPVAPPPIPAYPHLSSPILSPHPRLSPPIPPPPPPMDTGNRNVPAAVHRRGIVGPAQAHDGSARDARIPPAGERDGCEAGGKTARVAAGAGRPRRKQRVPGGCLAPRQPLFSPYSAPIPPQPAKDGP